MHQLGLPQDLVRESVQGTAPVSHCLPLTDTPALLLPATWAFPWQAYLKSLMLLMLVLDILAMPLLSPQAPLHIRLRTSTKAACHQGMVQVSMHLAVAVATAAAQAATTAAATTAAGPALRCQT